MSTPPAPQEASTWSPPHGGGPTASASSASPSSHASSSSSSTPSPRRGAATLASFPAGGGRGRGSSSTSSPSTSSTTSPPTPPELAHSCAACKHQRRRCPPGCVLARHFPADEPGKFETAHRMFGIKKMTRAAARVRPSRRDAVLRSVLYEANVRRADPVRGCVGVIEDLEGRVTGAFVERAAMRRLLASWERMTDALLLPNPPGSGGGGLGMFQHLLTGKTRYGDDTAASLSPSTTTELTAAATTTHPAAPQLWWAQLRSQLSATTTTEPPRTVYNDVSNGSAKDKAGDDDLVEESSADADRDARHRQIKN